MSAMIPPDAQTLPLHVFLFCRWKRDPAPPAGTPALITDLDYYLRAMRGPRWKMTVPLCLHGATETDVQKLETTLAYMETAICSTWFYPMAAWIPTRVFLIIVHAWATRDPRLHPHDWEGFRNLIPHLTSYERRASPPVDMLATIAGLAQLAKELFPTEIFHYKAIYRGEHRKALGRMFNLPTWIDAATQTSPVDMENTSGATTTGEMDDGLGHTRGEGMDGSKSDVEMAEDPRESYSITIPIRNLPYLRSPKMLERIPQ